MAPLVPVSPPGKLGISVLPCVWTPVGVHLGLRTSVVQVTGLRCNLGPWILSRFGILLPFPIILQESLVN